MRVVFALLVVLTAAACDDSYSAVVVVDDVTQCPGDGVTDIRSASIVGNDMTVTASYGGCKATGLWACWDSRINTLFEPPTLALRISHEPAGECDALQTSTVTFSLSPVVDNGPALQWDGFNFLVGPFDLYWQR